MLLSHFGGADFEHRCLVWFQKTLPTVSWGSGSSKLKLPFESKEQTAPEEKPQSKPASNKATKTKCLPALTHWHPSWAITAADSCLLPVCWMSSPRAGINVSRPCTGDGFLSSFALKIWVGRDGFPHLRCHGSTILGEGVGFDDCKGPFSSHILWMRITCVLQCLPGVGPVQEVRTSKGV